MEAKADSFLKQSIVEYLSRSAGEQSQSLVEQVASLLNVKPHTSSQAPSLEKIFSAGLASLFPEGFQPLTGNPAIPAELKDNKQFNTFLETVKKKGFFGDLAEDSSEYEERMKKVVAKFQTKFKPQKNDAEAKAEDLKLKGNSFLKESDFQKAVEMYSEAIEVSPTGSSSHIFYCNRAAAYQHLNENDKAVEDCAMAIALNSSYVKAHTRLAQIYKSLGEEAKAKQSAETALELDPENKVAKDIIGSGAPKTPVESVPGGGGFPNMGGMDLGALMNNPMMKQMADSMSKNPDMMGNIANMMSGLGGGNMADMMSKFGGGANGMPDLSQMMNNPQVKSMAEKMAQDPNMMETMSKMMGGMGKKKDGNSEN